MVGMILCPTGGRRTTAVYKSVNECVPRVVRVRQPAHPIINTHIFPPFSCWLMALRAFISLYSRGTRTPCKKQYTCLRCRALIGTCFAALCSQESTKCKYKIEKYGSSPKTSVNSSRGPRRPYYNLTRFSWNKKKKYFPQQICFFHYSSRLWNPPHRKRHTSRTVPVLVQA